MKDKRVLITGGNSGIGKVTAIALAAQGAQVVLACRDSDKTKQALAEIQDKSDARVVNLPVDLASFESVRTLARNFLEQFDRLDVLINNAGVFPAKQKITEDGYEMQFGVNHLAHFLLTNLLINCLKVSVPSRVVTVSSMMHKNGKIDFDSFKGSTKYNSQVAYGQSKLANILFAMELSDRLQDTGVTSNVLHPGGVRTDITRDFPWIVRKLIGLMFISAEKGAKTNIMLASDPTLVSVSGKYYDQTVLKECSPVANDVELRSRLWNVSAEATGC